MKTVRLDRGMHSNVRVTDGAPRLRKCPRSLCFYRRVTMATVRESRLKLYVAVDRGYLRE